MDKLHDTHNEYILDVLKDEESRLLDELLEKIPVEIEYTFNRFLEVIIEMINIYKK